MLLEEVFFRLPPDEPAWLVRASAVCKPWRCILADTGFRRRYREFHPTPPVLGLFPQAGTRLVPIPALFPAQPDHPYWAAMDCHHGRALFRQFGETDDLIVLDPVTGHQRRVPWPHDDWHKCSAAVLCAAQGCDHHSCQDGHFFVAFVTKMKKSLVGLAVLRVIDLKMLLPDAHLSIRSFTTTEYIPTLGGAVYEFLCPWVSGFVEGTQVIFVTTSVGSYLVDLKAERARKVSGPGRQFFPYTSFHIPAMEAPSTSMGEGQ